MTNPELIAAAIDASGVDASVFARALLGRDPRTIRRWKAGGSIPPHARTWLAHWVAIGEEERASVVRALLPAVGARKGVRALVQR